MAAGATYDLISKQTLTSATATITFNSISSGFTDLILFCQFGVTSQNIARLTFNNDTGNNYTANVYASVGTGSTANYFSAQGFHDILFNIRTNSDTVNPPKSLTAYTMINILNYANTNWKKSFIWFNGSEPIGNTRVGIGTYSSTSAISRIDLSCASSDTYLSGSIFSLYGVAAA